MRSMDLNLKYCSAAISYILTSIQCLKKFKYQINLILFKSFTDAMLELKADVYLAQRISITIKRELETSVEHTSACHNLIVKWQQ